MKILRYLLYTLAIAAGAFLIFLLVMTVSDYQPEESETVFQSEHEFSIHDSIFCAVTWNVGYAGLDSSMDFFYDGGKQVRPTRNQAASNVQCILQTLEEYAGNDFILLQEVDKRSKRSYRTDLYSAIDNRLPRFHSSFGTNYRVPFVPVPVKAPMGKVHSGLQTLSRYIPAEVTRHSFPGNYAWPVRLFMLDRCFLVNRYPLAGGSELVVINTHNSAYDDGSLREQQMRFLKQFLLKEYREGNYVLAGGDWNQTPGGFEPGFTGQPFDTANLTYLDAGYPGEGWTWAYDPLVPTNRRVRTIYNRGETPVTVIDFFLLSPNLEVLSVEGADLNFACSDHQPVILTCAIR